MSTGDRNEGGFSLIEVLAGLMLVGIFMMGLAGLFQAALLQSHLSRDTTTAATHAAERLEYLVALPSGAPELQAGLTVESLPGGYRRDTRIYPNEPAPGARTIKVSVRRGSSQRAAVMVGVRAR